MPINDAYYQLFSTLANENTKVTIITPNRRLAATLHEHYQQFSLEQQKNHWLTPDILPLLSWYDRMWLQYTQTQFRSLPQLLNQAQEQLLWEKIIVNSSQKHFLLQINKTAELIQSAYSLLQQWQIDYKHPAFLETEDYLACQEWIDQFTQICREKNYLVHANLPNWLCNQILKNNVKIDSTLILVGFLEVTPQLQAVLDATLAQNENKKPILFKLTEKNSMPTRAIFNDVEEELYTIANWAKQYNKISPHAKIGCVIPGLDKIRDRVQQIFTEIFPDLSYFNVSAGKPLAQYPVINAALQLLQLQKSKVSAAFFSFILHTPFIGHAEQERIARARWEMELHQENLLEIDILTLLNKEVDENHLSFAKKCPHLTTRLQNFLIHLPKANATHTYSEWATLFLELLSLLGWPGECSLNSEEYQVVESWLHLLNEFITLEYVASPVNYHEAWQTLSKLTHKKIFQPQSPAAPIQVLGLLEAAALPFDTLWLAGMNDMNWPEAAKPHPFIPKKLQRELQMPHATATRELIYCQQLLQQFKLSTNELIYSHAVKMADIDVEASSLIKDIPVITLDLPHYESPMQKIFQTKQLETIIDNHGPAFLPTEKIRGGVNILKAQALCPFKAFAEWRLNALPADNIQPGLRAKDRGNIIHLILERIWEELKDHATLCSLTDDNLQEIIINAIDTTLPNITKKIAHTSVYFALEKNRLQKLMNEWLQIEKKRPPFKVINHEKTAQISFSQFNLNIRIDRIDELSDGNKLIIDYKTGKNNDIKYWFSERPEEPQLPLYALLDKNIVGIVFAQIATGEQCFKGISHYTLDVPGIKVIDDIKQHTISSWPEQIIAWQTTLQQLSEDFYQGKASVDPKHPVETCTFCALKPFCRISEDIAHESIT